MTEPIIRVENLVKTFDITTAVDGVNFEVMRGEIFAFLGPNGAGKSTTIKMLTTLLRPTGGSIRINSYDALRAQDAVRRSFGIVFQDPSLDDELTAYENMELHATLYGIPRAQQRQRIEELLRLVELDTRQRSRVKTFSGGMKRRLEIARGLLHHPKILFLDEPTLGLDAQTRQLLWDYIRTLNHTEGMTIFFTTHYIEEAEEIADHIAIIDHGKIVALGTVSELTQQTGTDTLEDAYLAITGRDIRDETVSAGAAMRARVRARRMR